MKLMAIVMAMGVTAAIISGSGMESGWEPVVLGFGVSWIAMEAASK